MKYTIDALIIGSIYVDIEANSPADAKMKFLKQIDAFLNGDGEYNTTIENVILPTSIPTTIQELNICFPDKLTEDDKDCWYPMNVEIFDDSNDVNDIFTK